MRIRLLFVGDIVGKSGRKTFKELVNVLRDSTESDVVIVNVENAADGFGLTKEIYEELVDFADLMTTGNHVWDKNKILEEIKDMEVLIRPVNISPLAPGKGFAILKVKGIEMLVINVIGRIFMNPAENPFLVTEEVLSVFPNIKIRIIDFHAEATSEKQAFGWYFDGEVSAILGTHTHVQTADERILPKGTAYISDVGMTGCHDGVLGFGYDMALERFIRGVPRRLKVCKDNLKLDGCVVDIDAETGRALKIQRISRSFETI